MKKLVIGLVLIASSSIASAEQSVQQKEIAVQTQLDSHQACYFQNTIYSEGSIVTAGQHELQCVRAKGNNGFRTKENPLEWVKL